MTQIDLKWNIKITIEVSNNNINNTRDKLHTRNRDIIMVNIIIIIITIIIIIKGTKITKITIKITIIRTINTTITDKIIIR
jgi:hypothetical protein